MPDLARVSRLLADAYRLLSDQSLGRGDRATRMTAPPIPKRHWRRHGTDPLPTGVEAIAEPFNAFPSWFVRVTCERCGQERMFSQTHSAQSHMPTATSSPPDGDTPDARRM